MLGLTHKKKGKNETPDKAEWDLFKHQNQEWLKLITLGRAKNWIFKLANPTPHDMESLTED
jgi:hypothetical protein